jgi:hypothetical protein
MKRVALIVLAVGGAGVDEWTSRRSRATRAEEQQRLPGDELVPDPM